MVLSDANGRSAANSAPQGVSAVADAVHDGVQIMMASTASLAREPAAFLSDLVQDITKAGSRLVACRTPLDVLALQQSYLMERSQAWLDSAYRCFERCVVDQAGPQQEAERLVLPE
jgi:hypothetical protein